MAYRLKRDEALPAGLRRVVAEQLEGAVAALRGESDLPREQAVHDARKRLKKARAVLRLARGELGRKAYRRENTCLRDAARELAGARDGAVLVRTLDSVVVDAPPEVAHGLAPVAELLRERRDGAAAALFDRAEAVEQVAAELEWARSEVDGWPLERDRFALLAPGLRRAYADGAARFAEARAEPSAHRLHEWRKRVKDLWYQARLLEPLWPAGMGPVVQVADELADRLGDDHDLAVLRETLLAEGASVESSGTIDAALAIIDTRREGIRAEAFATGERLYAEKPKAFVRRVRAYWRAWRRDRDAQPDPATA